MNELIFRREKSTIITVHAICFGITLVLTGFLISSTNWFQIQLPPFLGYSSIETLWLWFAILTSPLLFAFFLPLTLHGYDMIRLDESGITVTNYSLFKKGKNHEYLSWAYVKKIEISGGGYGGAHIYVYRFDKTHIAFEYSKRIATFIMTMYHGEADKLFQ